MQICSDERLHRHVGGQHDLDVARAGLHARPVDHGAGALVEHPQTVAAVVESAEDEAPLGVGRHVVPDGRRRTDGRPGRHVILVVDVREARRRQERTRRDRDAGRERLDLERRLPHHPEALGVQQPHLCALDLCAVPIDDATLDLERREAERQHDLLRPASDPLVDG
jgi:hypothetical protein